jgi:hypothetical protein
MNSLTKKPENSRPKVQGNICDEFLQELFRSVFDFNLTIKALQLQTRFQAKNVTHSCPSTTTSRWGMIMTRSSPPRGMSDVGIHDDINDGIMLHLLSDLSAASGRRDRDRVKSGVQC